MADTARQAVEDFLRRGYESLDLNDPKYPEKLRALTETYRQMVADDTNKVTSETEEEKIRIEEKRIDFDAQVEKKRRKFDYIKTGILAGLAVGSGAKSIWAIKRSTEKEKDEAYLTLTDKTVMQDELREKQHWWEKIF